MITQFTVENYKSIQKLEMDLGRVTVLIGANGSGKSNILEALALGSAAANNKLDNEFLAARGIRVTSDPRLMRAAFEETNTQKDIKMQFQTRTQHQRGKRSHFDYLLQNDNAEDYSPWLSSANVTANAAALKRAIKEIQDLKLSLQESEERISRVFARMSGPQELQRFLIYSPEYAMLRTFEEEGQIQPLGIRGEGLFKLLGVIAKNDTNALADIKTRLECIDWFEDFSIPADPSIGERNLQLRDRYLDEGLDDFSQRSANEGFVFLLFFFCLFLSDDTPNFFAIDNIDTSLNPKLCSHLVRELDTIAAEKRKQVIFTTHNPAVLDGLDLDDDEQRLFVISRNNQGHTRAERVLPPQVIEGQTPVRLSEAFLRGYLGGLPRNF